MFLNNLCQFATWINTSMSLQGSFDVAFFITNCVFEISFIGSVLESHLSFLWGFSTLEHKTPDSHTKLSVLSATYKCEIPESWTQDNVHRSLGLGLSQTLNKNHPHSHHIAILAVWLSIALNLYIVLWIAVSLSV